MKVEVSNSTLKIVGNIKSIGDFQEIKNALDTMKNTHKSISLSIVDSISMTSSVVGYLVKLIHKDGVNVSISLGDKRLYSLLEELGLVSEFNVKVVNFS